MSLASAMSTALTGLNASETQISVVGNNLANANTVGFKASNVLFATQFLQTQSVGSSPTPTNGGTNPQQQGLGVMVADITPNFSQGTISSANSPTDLAIQGDGFFIVQGKNGEQNYTRNGTFTTNAQNQLVTGTGNRVMGYGVDSKFQINTTQLVPLSIPLGTVMVAKATSVATMQGALTPTGDIADTAGIIQTSPLTDGSLTYPGAMPTPTNGLAATKAVDSSGNPVPGGLIGDYQYYATFVNGNVESKPQPLAASATGLNSEAVTLSNFPKDSSGDWTGMTIYRSVNSPLGDTNFYPVPNATNLPLNTTSVTDTTDDATLISSATVNGVAKTLNKNGVHANGPTATITPDPNNPNTNLSGNLKGSYQYYVTFYNSTTNTESRPQLVATASPTLTDEQITLSNLPIPASGTWTSEKIYRNTNDQPGDTNCYQIGEIPMSTVTTNLSYTFPDNYSDQSIRTGGAALSPPTGASQVAPGSHVLSFFGPPISKSTLLTNVVEYNASSGTYSNPFAVGELSFTGSKGGNTLTTQNLTIAKDTTVGDLDGFLQGSLGIQSPPGTDPSNPIPIDTVTKQPAGVTVTSDGRINIVGNDGVANSVAIGLSALQLTSSGQTNAVSLPFNSTQTAMGQGATADMVAYDSLGIPLSVRITAVLENRTSRETVYRWYADCGQNDPGTGQQQGIAVGTGTILFDGQGNFISASNSTVSIGRANEPSVKPLQFNLDFAQVSGLASSTASLTVARQDGSAPGVLNSFNISDTGLISGVFSNGISQNLGQVELARFANPVGLEQVGQNMYSAGVNSGLPMTGNPGSQGLGTIVAGSLELSNTDVGASLINLITSSTMYQSNTRVITTATQLFDSLLQLGR
jgi:flagellar hook protein FlgE